MKILVIDIGGTNVKLLASDQLEPRRFPSGQELTPERMVAGVRALTADWTYEAVTIGLPAPIANGRPAMEPKNLGTGWLAFDFAGAFGKPVRMINDAAMQALGSYDGGRMLFLGLGTGLGSALVVDGFVVALELAHLPYKKERTFEDYVGERGLERMGKQKWTNAVMDVAERLRAAMVADYVVLGGGNSKRLKDLPPHLRLGDNRLAFRGGFRVWDPVPPEGIVPAALPAPIAESRPVDSGRPAVSVDYPLDAGRPPVAPSSDGGPTVGAQKSPQDE